MARTPVPSSSAVAAAVAAAEHVADDSVPTLVADLFKWLPEPPAETSDYVDWARIFCEVMATAREQGAIREVLNEKADEALRGLAGRFPVAEEPLPDWATEVFGPALERASAEVRKRARQDQLASISARLQRTRQASQPQVAAAVEKDPEAEKDRSSCEAEVPQPKRRRVHLKVADPKGKGVDRGSLIPGNAHCLTIPLGSLVFYYVKLVFTTVTSLEMFVLDGRSGVYGALAVLQRKREATLRFACQIPRIDVT
ncbi:hypothetical protein FOMPIDRAFT_1055418 [Fomitopsis schrenkii]|uniref:Uncharacterized protein n=1 Tax=Fomitopsis schrenkii TaxID=2126942 RepID=S8DS70_FOMSC|nr:hypothetical protein FOMPIDRAFT_1055418 [Fomitopsis schrenkii]